MSLVVWVVCECYVWPIVPGWPVRTCGYCGRRPSRTVPEPADGKAHPVGSDD